MKPILRILVVISLPLSNINIIYAQTNFWEEVNNGLYGGEVEVLAINDSGHVFVGFQIFGGIYRSTDNGDNWSYILTDNSAYALAINNSGHVFAVTFASVFRSTDSYAI